MKAINILFVKRLLIIVFLCLPTLEASSADMPDQVTKWEGLERAYKIFIPENVPDNAPLLLVLHDSNPGLFNVAAERHKFVVCYPRKEEDVRRKTHWNVGYPVQQDMTVDDVEYLTQLVLHLQDLHGLSRKNVFCTGKSNGGEMCYSLAAKRPKVFAAVAPIAGLMLDWLYRADYSAIAVPVLEIHGTDD